uniref:Naringenin 3-dioxygenase n=1 Tax=Solanum tuberosum TaxID=4113 RepID=M1ASR1_SOLTU
MTKLGCVPNALSHHCCTLTPPQSANALVHEFISENLLTSCSTMLDLLLVGGDPNRLKMWSCSQHKIKCLLDVSEIGKRYVVLVTFFEELSPNECKLLEVGSVGAGRIWFKLVEKVVVPWSAF